MAGNAVGGVKAAETNRRKHGDDFYKRIGAMGGKISRTGGFYANPKLASIAGKKGGQNRWKDKLTKGSENGVDNNQER